MEKQAKDQALGIEEGRSAVYELFIVVLTIYSLIVLILIVMPFVSEDVTNLLLNIDFIICMIFLIDFFNNLRRTNDRTNYFLRQGGWLDLMGSIPAVPGVPLTAIFRLARLGRLYRIMRIMRQRNLKGILAEFRERRAESALTIAVIVALLTITTAAVVVLQVESQDPDANIKSGSDAFWWAFVTVTTVGYGDRYPVSDSGRFFAMLLMVVGVGIFGVLTSYLSAAFIGDEDEDTDSGDVDRESLQIELSEIKSELAELKSLLRESKL